MTKYGNFGKGIAYVFFVCFTTYNLSHNFYLYDVSDIIYVNTIDAESNNILKLFKSCFNSYLCRILREQKNRKHLLTSSFTFPVFKYSP